ncbi:carbamoyltransferase HypF [Microbulbifer variabilis]|uniref:carbamoyltransferase HypF n=1 Tax=Microbulbifer variabilis TaxID=266805 RepID=UPI001CFD4E74|nr:carbamoyltransferase HypF [Microbulbifer variabilis]
MDSERRRVAIKGLVQGVGFRPYIYRLALDCQLTGWVANHSGGLQLEVEGETAAVEKFLQRLPLEKPPHSLILNIENEVVPAEGGSGFQIRESTVAAAQTTMVLPDLAPCNFCQAELQDSRNRRHKYPFINCTHCGPRFSIIDKLPYDRANTAMQQFTQCAKCQAEYANPANRRFHAEPNACPECGPQLQFCDAKGKVLYTRQAALNETLASLASGQIVALKGVGGFQLLVDAGSSHALELLRKRKQRPHKPFALLYSSLSAVRRDCRISELEAKLLTSSARPIVLLEAKPEASDRVHDLVALGSPDLGVMLPASPLHLLLAEEYAAPLVATSGNLAEEPICIENTEALQRLGKIADRFLLHNRRIVRPLDDSVMRVVENRPLMLRRARGYAPLPITQAKLSQQAVAEPYLALGADLKNSVALSHNGWIYQSQHIGDLGSATAIEHFDRTIADLTRLQQHRPQTLIHDQHPGYSSHRWALKQRAPRLEVQHHVAHLFSCMAEHGYSGAALGVCWDGTGFDSSGIVRGGEFLLWDGASKVEHVASLRTFPLPGGEKAVREPRRAAAGLLYEISGYVALQHQLLKRCFTRSERRNLVTMLEGEVNSPLCSSAGRLFDAVAALLGLCSQSSFEGQAALALEYSARGIQSGDSYPFDLYRRGNKWELDWAPCIGALIHDEAKSLPQRAAAFHNTLAHMILAVVREVGEAKVFLSGGVFQNRRLTESTAMLLRQQGFTVHCHSQIPPNDGGIALGQLHYAHCMAAAGQPVGG